MDFVYITKNKINGKKYIGSHTTNELYDNYLGSGILVLKAIKKYGKENFERQILQLCESREQAINLEEFFIKKHKTLIPKGYNISPYGNAAFPGEKNPMYGKDPWNKGINMTNEIKEKISKSLIGNKRRQNKKHTDETKKKISESTKGRIPWNKGKKITEETRKKSKESHKGQIPWNKGNQGISLETKEKMRLSKLGKPSPNKGKKFYIDENGNKKISKQR